jgi:hypothetical protein
MQREPNEIRSHARREAVVVLLVWLAATSYTVGYCVWHGYGWESEEITFVFGFPAWVFWGIIAPWFACVIFAWWFAYRFMTDEPLGDAQFSETGSRLDEAPTDVQ